MPPAPPPGAARTNPPGTVPAPPGPPPRRKAAGPAPRTHRATADCTAPAEPSQAKRRLGVAYGPHTGYPSVRVKRGTLASGSHGGTLAYRLHRLSVLLAPHPCAPCAEPDLVRKSTEQLPPDLSRAEILPRPEYSPGRNKPRAGIFPGPAYTPGRNTPRDGIFPETEYSPRRNIPRDVTFPETRRVSTVSVLSALRGATWAATWILSSSSRRLAWAPSPPHSSLTNSPSSPCAVTHTVARLPSRLRSPWGTPCGRSASSSIHVCAPATNATDTGPEGVQRGFIDQV
eukprot:1173155-Prorocentrum_minimum.AAC.2